MAAIKSIIHGFRRKFLKETSQDFWTRYNVTLHKAFNSPEESVSYFHWRNEQYFDYLKYMPVKDQDHKVVLDYGCGPGNDLVGFRYYSDPKHLIGMDVSPVSLAQARKRLDLHNYSAELLRINENDTSLPIENESIDYIHSSGVLHHVPDPTRVLREFKRILRPGGEARIMVYNYDSLWLHLHVAYIARVVKKLYRDISIREAFSRFTDGAECPRAYVYQPKEFIEVANSAGFSCYFLGAAMAVREFADFELRCSAIMDPDLAREHRQFLHGLLLDERGLPMHGDVLAGIDGCYSLRPN
jgi:ubiquinone/menaquinone biosynthesis C-methylase UbiE